jgi:DnaJ-class molecular chaperone
MVAQRLVWDSFFDLRDSDKNRRRSGYTLDELSRASREEFRNIIGEYFFNVYYQYYMENGNVNFNLYNPEILKWMGLPPDAGFEDIKKKFRELAKKYHPDTGGDSSKFIELMENYKKLVE